MTEDTIETVIDLVYCPRCGYKKAEFQHEPGKNFGTIYCPECERLAREQEESE